jgi:Ti-type conjugative transfer relaxase TraA
MASLSAQVSTVRRSIGQNAVASAAYNSRSKLSLSITDKTTNITTSLTWDYTGKTGLAFSKIYAPEHAPEWVYDREKLWNRCEEVENRCDATTAHKIMLPLPNELSLEQNVALLEDIVSELVKLGMVVDANIHDDNKNNMHAHLMCTMRELVKNRYGEYDFSPLKNRDWHKKTFVDFIREMHAEKVNEHYQMQGYDKRFCHKSYKELGIDLLPSVHEGPARNITNAELVELNQEIAAKNAEKIKAKPSIILDVLAVNHPVFTKEQIAIELEKRLHAGIDFSKVDDVEALQKDLSSRFVELYERILVSPELSQVTKADLKGRELYTTTKRLELEERFEANVKWLNSRNKHALNIKDSDLDKLSFVEKVSEKIRDIKTDAIEYINEKTNLNLEKPKEAIELSAEQRKAVINILNGGDISVLEGLPGAGKTTVMQEIVRQYKKAGFKVIGTAPSSAASLELAKSTGIECKNMSQWRKTWLKEQNKEFELVLRGDYYKEKNYAKLGSSLTKKHVLIIDEASMGELANMDYLLSEAKNSGAKIIMLGDRNQLSPVGWAGALEKTAAICGVERLEESRRQQKSNHQKATKLLSQYRVREALDIYWKEGVIKVVKTPQEARNMTISDFVDSYMKLADAIEKDDLVSIRAKAIGVYENKSREAINKEVREQLKEAGILKGEGKRVLVGSVLRDGKYEKEYLSLCRGEQIVFCRNEKNVGKTGIHNGEIGTILKIYKPNKGLLAKIDILAHKADGTKEKIRLDLSELATNKYRGKYFHTGISLDYGYAATSHKQQGATIDSTIVRLEKNTGFEVFNVLATRHREELTIIVDKETLLDAFYESLDKTVDSAKNRFDLAAESEEVILKGGLAKLVSKRANTSFAKDYKDIGLTKEDKYIKSYLDKSEDTIAKVRKITAWQAKELRKTGIKPQMWDNEELWDDFKKARYERGRAARVLIGGFAPNGKLAIYAEGDYAHLNREEFVSECRNASYSKFKARIVQTGMNYATIEKHASQGGVKGCELDKANIEQKLTILHKQEVFQELIMSVSGGRTGCIRKDYAKVNAYIADTGLAIEQKLEAVNKLEDLKQELVAARNVEENFREKLTPQYLKRIYREEKGSSEDAGLSALRKYEVLVKEHGVEKAIAMVEKAPTILGKYKGVGIGSFWGISSERKDVVELVKGVGKQLKSYSTSGEMIEQYNNAIEQEQFVVKLFALMEEIEELRSLLPGDIDKEFLNAVGEKLDKTASNKIDWRSLQESDLFDAIRIEQYARNDNSIKANNDKQRVADGAYRGKELDTLKPLAEQALEIGAKTEKNLVSDLQATSNIESTKQALKSEIRENSVEEAVATVRNDNPIKVNIDKQKNEFAELVSVVDTGKLQLTEKWDLADAIPQDSKIHNIEPNKAIGEVREHSLTVGAKLEKSHDALLQSGNRESLGYFIDYLVLKEGMELDHYSSKELYNDTMTAIAKTENIDISKIEKHEEIYDAVESMQAEYQKLHREYDEKHLQRQGAEPKEKLAYEIKHDISILHQLHLDSKQLSKTHIDHIEKTVNTEIDKLSRFAGSDKQGAADAAYKIINSQDWRKELDQIDAEKSSDIALRFTAKSIDEFLGHKQEARNDNSTSGDIDKQRAVDEVYSEKELDTLNSAAEQALEIGVKTEKNIVSDLQATSNIESTKQELKSETRENSVEEAVAIVRNDDAIKANAQTSKNVRNQSEHAQRNFNRFKNKSQVAFKYSFDEVKKHLTSSTVEKIFHDYVVYHKSDAGIKKQGDNLICGTTLSMRLSGSKIGLWHRFSTGEKGDIFQFVQEATGCSKKESLEIVASYTGLREIKGVSKSKRRVSQSPELATQSVVNAKQLLSSTSWVAKPIVTDFAKEFKPEKDLAFILNKTNSTITNTHEYRNANNQLLGYTVRIADQDGKKQVMPVAYCYDENGISKKEGWMLKGFLDNGAKPIYGLEKLTRNPEKPVLIVEGEKTADAATKLFPEYNVISWMGGAQGVGRVDWGHLKDRVVTIWGDNDGAGAEAAKNIANYIDQKNGFAGLVSIVDTDKLKLPKKWDLADAIPQDSKIYNIELNNVIQEAREHSVTVTAKLGESHDALMNASNSRDIINYMDMLVNKGRLEKAEYRSKAIYNATIVAIAKNKDIDISKMQSPRDMHIAAHDIQEKYKQLHREYDARYLQAQSYTNKQDLTKEAKLSYEIKRDISVLHQLHLDSKQLPKTHMDHIEKVVNTEIGKLSRFADSDKQGAADAAYKIINSPAWRKELDQKNAEKSSDIALRFTAKSIDEFLGHKQEARATLKHIRKYEIDEKPILSAFKTDRDAGMEKMQEISSKLSIASGFVEENKALINEAREFGYDADHKSLVKSLVGMGEETAKKTCVSIRDVSINQYLKENMEVFETDKRCKFRFAELKPIIQREQQFLQNTYEKLESPIEEQHSKNVEYLNAGKTALENPELFEKTFALGDELIVENDTLECTTGFYIVQESNIEKIYNIIGNELERSKFILKPKELMSDRKTATDINRIFSLMKQEEDIYVKAQGNIKHLQFNRELTEAVDRAISNKENKTIDQLQSLAKEALSSGAVDKLHIVKNLQRTTDLNKSCNEIGGAIENHQIKETMNEFDLAKSEAKTPKDIIQALSDKQAYLIGLEDNIKYPEQIDQSIHKEISLAKENQDSNVLNKLQDLSEEALNIKVKTNTELVTELKQITDLNRSCNEVGGAIESHQIKETMNEFDLAKSKAVGAGAFLEVVAQEKKYLASLEDKLQYAEYLDKEAKELANIDQQKQNAGMEMQSYQIKEMMNKFDAEKSKAVGAGAFLEVIEQEKKYLASLENKLQYTEYLGKDELKNLTKEEIGGAIESQQIKETMKKFDAEKSKAVGAGAFLEVIEQEKKYLASLENKLQYAEYLDKEAKELANIDQEKQNDGMGRER